MNTVHEFGLTDDDSTDEKRPVEEEYTTVFDDLRTELETPVEVQPLFLQVPNRPSIEVIYEPAIEFDLLRAWIKKSSTGRKKEFDPLLFAFQILSFTCRGIRIRGKEATEDGEPMTFASRTLQEMLGTTNPRAAIRNLYGGEGHIISASQYVLEAAGYGDVDMDEGDDNPLNLG